MLGWHINPKFTGPEKNLRSLVTSRYGYYSIGFFVAFLLLISLINAVAPRLHTIRSIFKHTRKEEEQQVQLQLELSKTSSGLRPDTLPYTDDASPTSELHPGNQQQEPSAQISQSNNVPALVIHGSSTPPVKNSNSSKLLQSHNKGFSDRLAKNLSPQLPAQSTPGSEFTANNDESDAEDESRRLLDSDTDTDSINNNPAQSSHNAHGHSHSHSHSQNSKNDSSSYAERQIHAYRSKAPRSPPSTPTLSQPWFPSWLSKYTLAYTRILPSRAVSLPLVPIVSFWTVAFLFLIFNETHYEFTYLSKRLGHVSVALLPPVYFLTLKPSPLPRTFYLQLIPLHKWLSRLIFLIIVAHAAVYLYIYIVTKKLMKLTSYGNICGIIAFFMFVAMILTSLKPIRRRFYNTVFFPAHYIISWAVLPLIYYHSPKTIWIYVYLCAGILIGQQLYRLYISRSGTRLPVQYISSSMLFVALPKNQLPTSLQNYFSPGSHLRISSSPMPGAHLISSIPLPGFLQRWKRRRGPGPNGGFTSSLIQSTHPYTIASLPEDPVLMLCIRKTRYPIKLNKGYTVAGPYASIPSPFFNDVNNGLVKRALFVAGGTGIAFCAPLMRHLRSRNIPVKLIWAVRDASDAKVLTHLGLAKAALEDKQIEIYVTQSNALISMKERTARILDNIKRVTRKPSGKLTKEAENDASERSAASGTFEGMFTPQTVDERLEISIDNTWCDGGEVRTIGGKQSKSVPSYVDEYGHITDFDTSNGPSTRYDEESALQSQSLSFPSYGSLSNSAGPSTSAPATQAVKTEGLQYINFPTLSATPELDFTPVMINSRPVLNLRIKSWLYGVAVDGDSCCCIDQLLKVDHDTDRSGRWILASGGETLVKETEKWSRVNDFSFFKDEFSL